MAKRLILSLFKHKTVHYNHFAIVIVVYNVFIITVGLCPFVGISLAHPSDVCRQPIFRIHPGASLH